MLHHLWVASLAQLPGEHGYAPAVLVLTRVVSRPHSGIVTCDAGHKSVSADAGVPTCVVVGHPELVPLTSSEEHLPLGSLEEMHRPDDRLNVLLIEHDVGRTDLQIKHAPLCGWDAVEDV